MIYKRGKWYHMDDTVNGVRFRLPLRTKNWQEALRREKEKLSEIAEGKLAESGASARLAFDGAMDAYLEHRKLHKAPRTHQTDKEKAKPLRAFFGKNGKDVRLRQITGAMITEYQAKRTKDGVAGRTVNMEIGPLRRVLKKNKQWARLAEDVTMLTEQPREITALTPDQKKNLLKTAARKPEWQVARCAGVVALNTTMRGCELKGLRWKDVNLFDKILYVGRGSTKTDAGARAIPLNRAAVLAFGELWERAQKLGCAEPENFVFPACENGHIDPNRPMMSWRSAWRSLTKAADLTGLRFHDLRHQCVTELAERGESDQTIMSIAGHVSRRMLDHYSHIRITAKRKALEGLETNSQDQPRNPQDTPAQDASATVN